MIRPGSHFASLCLATLFLTMMTVHAFLARPATSSFILQKQRCCLSNFAQLQDDKKIASLNVEDDFIPIFEARNESSIMIEISQPLKEMPSQERPSPATTTRRDFFARSFVAAIAIFGSRRVEYVPPNTGTGTSKNMDSTTRVQNQLQKQQVEPLDIPKIIEENNINVTVSLKNENAKVYVNRTSFEKVQETNYPPWVPKLLRRNPQVIGKVDDRELLFASIFAASLTELFRATILYPLLTVKTRLQATSASEPMAMRLESEEIRDFFKSFLNSIAVQIKAGKLYTGYIPYLITAVPATGAYFGVRDVIKREMIQSFSVEGDLTIALSAALVADVVSLAVKTPALIFSVRQQAATKAREDTVKVNEVNDIMDVSEENEKEITSLVLLEVQSANPTMKIEVNMTDCQSNERQVTEDSTLTNGIPWDDIRTDFIRQFPTIIFTDLPYLLLRIILLRSVLTGTESVPEYEILNIAVACFAAFITTPFDVARTRILVDSDRDPSNGLDGGTDEGILEAMNNILHEGGESSNNDAPRIEKLFSGWFLRVAYFGIAASLLDPIRVLGYIGIRDLLLLQDFMK